MFTILLLSRVVQIKYMGKYKTVLLLCQVPEQIKKQKSPAAALPDIFMLPG